MGNDCHLLVRKWLTLREKQKFWKGGFNNFRFWRKKSAEILNSQNFRPLRGRDFISCFCIPGFTFKFVLLSKYPKFSRASRASSPRFGQCWTVWALSSESIWPDLSSFGQPNDLRSRIWVRLAGADVSSWPYCQFGWIWVRLARI